MEDKYYKYTHKMILLNHKKLREILRTKKYSESEIEEILKEIFKELFIITFVELKVSEERTTLYVEMCDKKKDYVVGILLSLIDKETYYDYDEEIIVLNANDKRVINGEYIY